MRGEPARVKDFEGYADAQQRLAQTVAWLDMNAAILRGDDVEARAPADEVADPARREFVEAALRRWRTGPRAS